MSLELVPVHVCGHQLEAKWKPSGSQGPPSIQSLKETVESGIGMKQDWIQFFDNQGTKLFTDEEVSEAIRAKRTPIWGTLSDHAVHNFEQRREEFAHMQWKVIRDQYTVMSLQLGHTQKQLKSIVDEARVKEEDQTRKMTLMMKQLAEGLLVVSECKDAKTHMQRLLNELHENVLNMDLKLDHEAKQRSTDVQHVDAKMDRLNTTQTHENAKLAKAFDSCLSLLQEADSQFGQDLNALEQKVESVRDLANANHEAALKQVAEAVQGATRALSDASSEIQSKMHRDSEMQVNELANQVSKFELRIVKSETLASDVSNRWLASHEQLKGQYNSISQAVEQCHLQSRTDHAATQDLREKLLLQDQSVQATVMAMKTEQLRERQAREQQFKAMQQNLDGILKSTLTELELKMSGRIDQEADARTATIRQAVRDIGRVCLEKDAHCWVENKLSVLEKDDLSSSAVTVPRLRMQMSEPVFQVQEPVSQVPAKTPMMTPRARSRLVHVEVMDTPKLSTTTPKFIENPRSPLLTPKLSNRNLRSPSPQQPARNIGASFPLQYATSHIPDGSTPVQFMYKAASTGETEQHSSWYIDYCNY